MSKQEEEEPQWVRLQKKAFTKWANVYLGMRKMSITDLYTDLASGVALINMLEVIGGESVCRKYTKKPKMRIQQLENVGFAFKYLEKKGVTLLNTGPNDVVDGNGKIILGLMWSIISNFQISDIKLDGVSGKDGLLLWYKRQVSNYDIKVSNFTSSFKNGLAFCALLHKFRPAVIPWEELVEANDPHRALETAFSVAQTHFGVERLMDPEDLADVRRPDEKIVCCYVSFLFQAIGKLAKQDALVKSIRKAMDITRQHDAKIQQYLDAARASSQWIAATTAKFQGSIEGNTAAGIKAALDAFYRYRRAEKSSELAKLASLAHMLTTLRTSQRNNNRPEYTPPPEASVAVREAAWKELEESEDSYEQRVRDRLSKFQVLENTLARFDAKYSKVVQWMDRQAEAFASTDHGHSVAEVETLMDEHKAYEEQARTYGDVVETLNEWATQGGMDEHAMSQHTCERVALLRQRQADLHTAAASYAEALQASLAHQHALVEKSKAYNSQSAMLLYHIDEFEEDVVNEPIPTTSTDDVEAIIAAFEATTPSRLAEVTAEHDRVQALARELTEAGVTTAFKRFPVHAAENRLTQLNAALAARKEKLAAALEHEKSKEALRVEFAEAAANFKGQCEATQEACANVTGSLEEQLEAVRAIKAELEASKEARQATVAACASKLEAAGVVNNPHTRENVDTLLGRADELAKFVDQTEQTVHDQVIAASAGDLTLEQIKEMKETFVYFDADKDDNLSPEEFYSCTTGIGLVLSEEEMKEAFASIDVSGDGLIDFEEFSAFMAEQLKDPGFAHEDVLRAFDELAGPGSEGTMTDEQISRFFSENPEDVAYLQSNMPPVVTDAEGSASGPTCRSTVAFVDELFTR